MKKKAWSHPELYIIAIAAKTITGPHEHNYTSQPTPAGHKWYLNTPNHNSFANGIQPTIHQYLS